jgi:hypothetical protein
MYLSDQHNTKALSDPNGQIDCVSSQLDYVFKKISDLRMWIEITARFDISGHTNAHLIDSQAEVHSGKNIFKIISLKFNVISKINLTLLLAMQHHPVLLPLPITENYFLMIKFTSIVLHKRSMQLLHLNIHTSLSMQLPLHLPENWSTSNSAILITRKLG